ncbi:MAG: SusD/RagB family nutrient-binding outer membrane lipoprotein [Haliscomenobacter sp.]|nr:SusD/RagB family nutrient-binding outer membrane lipoprotein [Haliscomenobacter sp.]
MKYKFKLLWAFALVFMLSSCGDMFDLDINVDPNNPQTTTPNLLLTNAQRELAYQINAYSDNAQGFMGIISSFDSWQISQSAFNGRWRTAYSSILKDLEGIIATNSGATGSPQYLGIAQLLKAYIVSNMVDFFGDIPYSEALRGDDPTGAIKNPKFDDDQAIYAECLKLIDQGIANVTNARVPVAVSGDVIYGGSAARWEKFGRTLKLRLYLNTRLVDAAKSKSEIEALITGGKLISADADDFLFPYSKVVTPDNRHPWYQSTYTSGTNGFTYILHQIMLEMLEDGDPRVPYYFRRIQSNVLNQDDPSQRNTTPCSQASCSIGYFPLSPVVEERLYTNKNIPYTAAKTYMAGFLAATGETPRAFLWMAICARSQEFILREAIMMLLPRLFLKQIRRPEEGSSR